MSRTKELGFDSKRFAADFKLEVMKRRRTINSVCLEIGVYPETITGMHSIGREPMAATLVAMVRWSGQDPLKYGTQFGERRA